MRAPGSREPAAKCSASPIAAVGGMPREREERVGFAGAVADRDELHAQYVELAGLPAAEEVAEAGYAVSATTGRATTIEGLQYQYLTNGKIKRAMR